MHVPVAGLRIAGIFGAGRVDDDYDDDGNVDLRYRGWDMRLIWSLGDAFGGMLPVPSLAEEHDVELVARYDRFRSHWNGVGYLVREQELTVGVNYLYRSYVRVMLDGIFRRTRSPGRSDLADDGVLLSLQVAI